MKKKSYLILFAIVLLQLGVPIYGIISRQLVIAYGRIREHSSEYTMLASVARYHVLDELVRSFAARYPDGCNVINLGAGLETMAQRLSLPAVTFYEIDLPKNN